jgi:glycerol-3-phosphate dehydrogenase (NAD(P)+)
MGINQKPRITVLGAGMWGTVLAEQFWAASRGKTRVSVWEFDPHKAALIASSRRHPHLAGLRLDPDVTVTSDLRQAIDGADVILFALPSTAVRTTARAIKSIIPRSRPYVINASKGIDHGTLKTMGQVIESELPNARAVYTLSGPSFAREVARGVKTKLALAGPSGPDAERLRRLLNGGVLRVDWTPDRVGVEVGGSLKNVLAIACGILDGLGSGANTKAALIIQGIQEMAAIVRALGGKPETIYGVAGLGDLVLSGTSLESRNRALGEKLAGGRRVSQAQREIPTIVEGIEAVKSARRLARSLKLKLPLLSAIWDVVHGGKRPERVLAALGFKDINHG